MAFDNIYYTDKKQKLIAKAQILQQEYLQGAFRFTNEIREIELEINKIVEWEKEQDNKIEKKSSK